LSKISTGQYSWVGVGILGRYRYSVFFKVGIGIGILKHRDIGIGIFSDHHCQTCIEKISPVDRIRLDLEMGCTGFYVSVSYATVL